MPLYEQAYNQLKQNIMSGLYKPGERLTDLRLTEDLGFSRTPIREALKQLINEGLLVNEPNKGVSVFNPVLEDIAEVYALRASVEGTAAGLAALNEKRKQYLYYMMELIELSEIAEKNQDIKVLTESNIKFHDYILKASGSKQLFYMLEPLRAKGLLIRSSSLSNKRHSEVSISEHRQIFEMIKNGDSKRAEEFIRNHILSAGYRLLIKNNEGQQLDNLPIFKFFKYRQVE
ncbi:GntR family transcriptional regulator [Tepidibacillus infernus]|nr:GntR family transcriptional regulator [Tepidibacillus decaturensis]